MSKEQEQENKRKKMDRIKTAVMVIFLVALVLFIVIMRIHSKKSDTTAAMPLEPSAPFSARLL